MDSEQIAFVKNELRRDGYSIYVYSYPAGMCFGEHQHNYSKLHVVLSGLLRVTFEGEDHILHSGDRLLVPARTPHSAEVLGETSVVCIDATKFTM